jgi:plastocyanin
MTREIHVPVWVAATLVVVAVAIGAVALVGSIALRSGRPDGMMAGYGTRTGMMGGNPAGYGPGMMGGAGNYGPGRMGGRYGNSAGFDNGPQPGSAGFVAGTAASPRVIHIVAGPGYSFSPSAVSIARGETVTFVVTSMGPLVHEFMVGPADAVAADRGGTPEVADIGMMQSRSLTYTFDGSGAYAYACHAAGHYENGMRGTISIVD